ncbi:2'-5'-oligoadenylate synthase 1-like [Gigantopelta aegis]|uniref:2'-5'-oligoadenylate synthase 1-like n=1 Tax=Gigantopelta aegis TaxID=1735272 RepID=UPI001B88B290|nr:2'-5'-oligoadenylate synthase 1-like [Gigantopelta aegis]
MNHYISQSTSSTNSWLSGVLKGGQKGQNLNDFMQKNVFPDKEYKTKSKEVVDRLKMFVQHNTGYNIKELFVGGSQGKKTNLLGHSDVDLVMYSNRYGTMKEFRKNVSKDLQALTNHMKKDLTWAKGVNITRTTKHAVQFEVKLPGYAPIKVDLLPAPDLLQNKEPKYIYKEMKTLSEEERQYYSVCFAKKQTEFVKYVPPDVKHLTRLVKYWTKTENVPVKSYFTELLVIDSWKRWGKPDEFPIQKKFLSIIHRLKDLSDLRRMRWKENNTTMKTFPDLPPEGPVLLDVMNPFNNVAPTGEDVREVEEKATSLLDRKPTWSTE